MIAIQKTKHEFAVYMDGDDDYEGNHDRLFSYGRSRELLTEAQARREAIAYAESLAKRFAMIWGFVEDAQWP